MASSLEFVHYVTEQLSDAGEISFKKMFGEYGLYCAGKFFACICDDQLFVKITNGGKTLMPNCKLASPYTGASPYFLIDEFSNKELLTKFIQITCDELPVPKQKKKGSNK